MNVFESRGGRKGAGGSNRIFLISGATKFADDEHRKTFPEVEQYSVMVLLDVA